MSRRTLIVAVVAALAVIVAAVVAVRSLRTPSRYASDAAPVADVVAELPVEAAADVAAPAPAASVESVAGQVTVRRAGVDSPVLRGAPLEPDDVLTTGPDGRATVRVDEQTSVLLESGTTVTWGTITDSLSSVQLDRGFLSARTGEEGGRVFRVQALDRTAQVEASAGDFDVAGDREQVAVAAASGDVAVQSAGETVQVGAGSYTTVRRGERPGVPRQLPGEVVAEIFWPGDAQGDGGERLVADRSVVVQGKLGGGLSGVLTIRNENTGDTYRVVTRPDGSFEAQVVLAENQSNGLVVAGSSIGGRAVAEQRASLLQDSTPPPLTVRVQ
jgi:hypothetical protein